MLVNIGNIIQLQKSRLLHAVGVTNSDRLFGEGIGNHLREVNNSNLKLSRRVNDIAGNMNNQLLCIKNTLVLILVAPLRRSPYLSLKF